MKKQVKVSPLINKKATSNAATLAKISRQWKWLQESRNKNVMGALTLKV